MKTPIFISVLFIFFISSCALKVDEQKAKELTSSLLNDVKNEKYDDLNKYYSNSFNESEPTEKKVAKFQRLKDSFGPVESYELLSSKQEFNNDQGLNQVVIKYKVKRARVTTEETFLVINDEGKERIIFHNIENLK